jgi:methionyl aminopeptidase
MVKLKSDKQIEGIRGSSKILAQVLKELSAMVEPGISTADLDSHARQRISELGGTPAFLGYMDFPAAICTSVDSAIIHGIPNKTPLREGQVVSIDCGINLEGYYSDSAVSVRVGGVSEEVDRLLRTAQESLDLGIEAARVGNRVYDISRAIYRHNKQQGYGIVRPYCGHGIGLEIHEDPQIPNYVGSGPNPRLKPGMVVAIEPMINLGGDAITVLDDDWTVVTRDGSVSAHFEHTVAILKDRTEVLTSRDAVG